MTIPAIGGITSALSGLTTSAISSAASSLASAAGTGAAGTASSSAAGSSNLTAGSAIGAPGDLSTGSASGADFASMLNKGLNAVQSAQSTADGLAVRAATGDLTDIHAYTIAATQASLVTELATAIRTKGVDAFNQIMGMQA